MSLVNKAVLIDNVGIPLLPFSDSAALGWNEAGNSWKEFGLDVISKECARARICTCSLDPTWPGKGDSSDDRKRRCGV